MQVVWHAKMTGVFASNENRCYCPSMPTPGRPTLYHPDFAETAHNYCLLGAINADLAAFFDVAPRTVDNWIATHDDFAAAVRRGRAAADARVARCLYEKAVGYERTVERTVLHQGREHTLSQVVHVAPDTRACIFWLRNRQPAAWNGSASGAGRDGDDPEGHPSASRGGRGWGRPTEADLAELDAAGERARAAGLAALARRAAGGTGGSPAKTPPSREDGVGAVRPPAEGAGPRSGT